MRLKHGLLAWGFVALAIVAVSPASAFDDECEDALYDYMVHNQRLLECHLEYDCDIVEYWDEDLGQWLEMMECVDASVEPICNVVLEWWIDSQQAVMDACGIAVHTPA